MILSLILTTDYADFHGYRNRKDQNCPSFSLNKMLKVVIEP